MKKIQLSPLIKSYLAPLSTTTSFFSIEDKIVSAISFLLALTTFWYSALPNIGFGDDGEMATAAIHFGVPHPSGYPLWTLLAGLFSRLPWGNAIWKINLFSGLTAAAAVAIFGLIASHSIRWFGLKNRSAPYFAGIITLLLSWSLPVWSQATIGKGTYSLHLFFMLALVALCYYWIHHPQWPSAFLSIAFCFALSMSNHHMTLPMALLPLLLMAWLRPKDLWEYLLYVAISASLFYLGFAALSHLPLVIKAAHRFLFLVIILLLIAVIAAVLLKKKFLHLREGVLLPYVIALGLLPYLYMPLASSTNPPMNWGYTKTEEGFFNSINRTEYWGPLSEKLQETIGILVGAPPISKKATLSSQKKLFLFWGFNKRFFNTLNQNLSWLIILLFISCYIALLKLDKYQQLWLLTLTLSFLINTFLEPLLNPRELDNNNWRIQKPWHGTSYAMFLLIALLGVALLIKFMASEKRHKRDILPSISRYGWKKFLNFFSANRILVGLFILLSINTFFTLLKSTPESFKKNNWLGWMLGHDTLVSLPPKSILISAKDSDFFIFNAMIHCESREKPLWKKDPYFDRHDVYIIRGYALSNEGYLPYLYDQYIYQNKRSYSWFERLLGRPDAYPLSSIKLPSHPLILDLYHKILLQKKESKGDSSFLESQSLDKLQITLTQWIFLQNHQNYHFFIQELSPTLWAYPYAVPHGLCYELQSTPIPHLSQATVNKDTQFWNKYINKLLKTPGFQNDHDAHVEFSKLRGNIARLYYYRGMLPEAAYAFKQAIQLYPDDASSLSYMANIAIKQKQLREFMPSIESAYHRDPYSVEKERLYQECCEYLNKH